MSSDVRCVAVIPARGGSKGIPRKNLLQIDGKTILGRCIDAARQADLVNCVAVSTDDEEIAAVAKSHGAQVVWRPEDLATDTASSESALLHAIDVIEGDSGPFEILVFLQCTSPLTSPADIDATVKVVKHGDADTAFTVTEFHHFLWREDHQKMAAAVNHDAAVRFRRQDSEIQYQETGGVYSMKVDGFRRYRHRFFGKTEMVVIPTWRSWEIDEMEDVVVVNALLTSAQAKDSHPKQSSLDLSWCKAVVFDFDGVLTENGVWVDQDGTESVRCDRRDGYGFELARNQGLRTLILSKEQNIVVKRRAEKLNCEVIHGANEKVSTLSSWLKSNNLSWGDIAYLGNDVNDLGCIQNARCGIAVADAEETILASADWVTQRRGGCGAAREVLDQWIASQ